MIEINHTVELMETQETIQVFRSQLQAAQDEWKMSNSELMQLTMEMDDRVIRRRPDIEKINQQFLCEIEERIPAQCKRALSEETNLKQEENANG